MSQKGLDETLDFIRDVERCNSPADVCRAVLKAVSKYGFKNILAGTIPEPRSDKSQQEAHVILHQWPEEWWQRYFTNGYLYIDPAIKRVTTNTTPFLWDELNHVCRTNLIAARVMDEAADFRLRKGFTVPLITLEGNVAGFTIAGEQLELPPHAHGMISLLATYALGHSLKLRSDVEDGRQIGITAREREVLQWSALGKTMWDVSEILQISEHTVDKHLRSAKRKLDALTLTQAVAEAVRLHIIH